MRGVYPLSQGAVIVKFYSSYFGNVDNMVREGYKGVFISISLWDKKVWSGYRMRSLNCSRECLMDYKRDGDIDKYIERYKREVLDKKDCKKMVDDLEKFFGGRDVCFLCYEGKNKFCHRKLVGEWLVSNGYYWREW